MRTWVLATALITSLACASDRTPSTDGGSDAGDTTADGELCSTDEDCPDDELCVRGIATVSIGVCATECDDERPCPDSVACLALTTDGSKFACVAADGCDDYDGDGVGWGPGCDDIDCDESDPAVHPGAEEVCGDNRDNNCDGTVDEACPCNEAVRGCESMCGFGTQTCTDGRWSVCSAPTRTTEVCNRLDDDCDGLRDDNIAAGSSCITGLPGVCGPGQLTCRAGALTCVSTTAALVEVCSDGLDNDCNGTIDDRCPCNPGEMLDCSGTCGEGLQVCTDAGWGFCNAPNPSPEVCNGIDDNCNGEVDDQPEREGTTCATGASGICAIGTRVCREGTQRCEPDLPPQTEVCDGLDNNCNGNTDEGCPCDDGATQACSTICGNGSQTCIGGAWGPCDAATPTAEVCNGVDDDCNGTIDDVEGVGSTCVTGLSGICQLGRLTCQQQAVVCVAAVSPRTEECDGLDNDCDGNTDEDCPCEPGQTQPCTGECAGGLQTCALDGFWGPCDAVEPQPEVCDGVDNDCNGLTDDVVGLGNSCDTGELGICMRGTQRCVGNQLACVANSAATSEVCDGVDNDCNGDTDEVCNCEPGESRPCESACGDGREFCDSTYEWGACDATEPDTEVCDGTDNDCDGQTDEGCDCQPGQTQSCSTECGTGQQFCESDFRWSDCDAPQPDPEVCDGLDNDCDADVDEVCECSPVGATRACANSCGNGIETCNSQYVWGACNAPQPDTEVCDGNDNDCDDQIDELGVCPDPCGIEVKSWGDGCSAVLMPGAHDETQDVENIEEDLVGSARFLCDDGLWDEDAARSVCNPSLCTVDYGPSIAWDTSGIFTKYYIAVLNRSPDPTGLGFWNDEGDTDTAVYAFVLGSSRTGFYNSASNEALVSDFYFRAFNRAPDAAGLGFYAGLFADGTYDVDDASFGAFIRAFVGAGGPDATSLTKRIQVAEYFAQQLINHNCPYDNLGCDILDGGWSCSSYDPINCSGNGMGVDASSDVSVYEAMIDARINELEATPYLGSFPMTHCD